MPGPGVWRDEETEGERGKGAEELGASLGILPPGRTITPTTRHQLQNIVHICFSQLHFT